MAVAPPLMLAAAALSAGGQLYQGISENKAARRAARDDVENARLAFKSGEQEAMDVLREALFAQGEAAASIGGGLVFGGSVSTVLADSARAAELDIERVRQRARGEAANYYTQANERRRAGKAALVSGVFSAVASAIGTAGDIGSRNAMAGIAANERRVQLGSTGTGPTYSYRPDGYHRRVPR